MGKTLHISCALCDARNVQESTLAAYDQVAISSATLLAGREARALLGKYAVKLSVAQTVDCEGDAQVSTLNGRAELRPGQSMPAGKTFLIVNGSLFIAPGSEELLKNYLGIAINGTVTCPESLVGLLPAASVNGTINTYPDDCILLKGTAELDRTFHLRAKRDARYYAAGRIVALAPDIAFDKLAEANVQFVTRRLLVAEGLAEAAIPLFDEQTDITVLPDGCAYVGDDITLDSALLRQYGGKLYVNGDVSITRESVPCLSQVSYLQVTGDLLVTRGLEEAAAGLHAIYDSMQVCAETQIRDRPSVVIDRFLLEGAAEGLEVRDCGKVEVRSDVPLELLRERLLGLRDCGSVVCTEEQRGLLTLIAEDVERIGPEAQRPQASEEEKDVVRISAANYTL